MNKKKIMATMAGLMTLSVALTACGSGDSDSKKPGGDKKQEDQSKIEIKTLAASDPSKIPEAAKNRKGTMIIGINAPDGILNPLYATSSYDVEINELMFSGLFITEKDGSLKEHLAELPKVSEDGKKYTVKLKDGLKWSDGKPITTDDIELAFKIYCDGTYTGRADMPTLDLVGWRDYKDGKADNIAGIKKIDKQTIEFTVGKPTAKTERMLGVAPMPSHYYGQVYKQGSANLVEDLHRKPEVNSGPYKFVSFKEGQEVVLKANENYFKGKPKIENVIYKVTTDKTVLAQLESGEIDMANVTIDEDNVEQIQGMEYLNIHYYPFNGYGYIGLNQLGDSKLKDVKVRQALTYGLNREEIVKNIYGPYAEPMNVPQAKISWAYPKDVKMEEYKYDKEKAQKLLEEAGWKKNSNGKLEKDGKIFTLKFLQTADNEVAASMIPVAKKNYEELGIEFTAEQLDFTTLRKKILDAKQGKPNAEYDMYFAAWGLTPEPDSTNLFTSKGMQNDIGYSNPKVDEIMRKGLEEFDLEKRKEIYKELYTELNKDLPYIYIYQRSNGYALSSRIKNFQDEPFSEYTVNIHEMELTE
ncbi:ABC transporter substrate-binding protein [Clostridium sp.]|uniref:ABC transporter substrate-binding protein n=1 Tax=Clostridium sp. TaxID=1506 RepID=UPI003463ECFF